MADGRRITSESRGCWDLQVVLACVVLACSVVLAAIGAAGFWELQLRMITRNEIVVHCAAAGVLPVEQPVHIRTTAAIGAAAFWEQRYWHAELREDGRSQRSLEYKRSLRQRLVATYDLQQDDISRPSDSAESPQTVLLNTRALLGWLLHKLEVFGRRELEDAEAKGKHVMGMVRRICTQAARASRDLDAAQLPVIEVADGVELVMQPGGHIDVSEFAAACGPELGDEWDMIAAVRPDLGLPPFDPQTMLVADFLMFMDVRCRVSAATPDDWVWQVRNAAVHGTAFLAEYCVTMQLQQDQRVSRLRAPHVLLGPRQMRRQKHMVLTKIDIQRRILEDGSGATQAHAVGFSRGMACTLQFIQNEHYSEQCQASMRAVTSMCLCWDQSTHGGYDMNIGFALDSNSKNGCYVRPTAIQSFISWVMLLYRFANGFVFETLNVFVSFVLWVVYTEMLRFLSLMIRGPLRLGRNH